MRFLTQKSCGSNPATKPIREKFNQVIVGQKAWPRMRFRMHISGYQRGYERRDQQRLGFDNDSRGFSLIEIVASLAILSLLLSIAAPSFAGLISKSNVKTTATQFTQALYTARSAAVSYGNNVLICPIEENTMNCNEQSGYNQVWENGWQTFVDSNSNNQLDEQDLLLERRETNSSTKVVFNQKGRLRFFPDGSARSAGFYICGENTEEIRHIKLLHSGRTRVSAKTSSKAKINCEKA